MVIARQSDRICHNVLLHTKLGPASVDVGPCCCSLGVSLPALKLMLAAGKLQGPSAPGCDGHVCFCAGIHWCASRCSLAGVHNASSEISRSVSCRMNLR